MMRIIASKNTGKERKINDGNDLQAINMSLLASLHPETVLFRPGGVNHRALLVRRTDVRLRATP
jgi:hypothetical protein